MSSSSDASRSSSVTRDVIDLSLDSHTSVCPQRDGSPRHWPCLVEGGAHLSFTKTRRRQCIFAHVFLSQARLRCPRRFSRRPAVPQAAVRHRSAAAPQAPQAVLPRWAVYAIEYRQHAADHRRFASAHRKHAFSEWQYTLCYRQQPVRDGEFTAHHQQPAGSGQYCLRPRAVFPRR